MAEEWSLVFCLLLVKMNKGAKDQTDKAINLSVEIYFWQVNEKEEIGSTQMKSVLCHQATLQVVDQPNLTPAKGQVCNGSGAMWDLWFRFTYAAPLRPHA